MCPKKSTKVYKPVSKSTSKPASKSTSKSSSYGIFSPQYRKNYISNLAQDAKKYSSRGGMSNLQRNFHNYNIGMNNGGSSDRPFKSYSEDNSGDNNYEDYGTDAFGVRYDSFSKPNQNSSNIDMRENLRAEDLENILHKLLKKERNGQYKPIESNDEESEEEEENGTDYKNYSKNAQNKSFYGSTMAFTTIPDVNQENYKDKEQFTLFDNIDVYSKPKETNDNDYKYPIKKEIFNFKNKLEDSLEINRRLIEQIIAIEKNYNSEPIKYEIFEIIDFDEDDDLELGLDILRGKIKQIDEENSRLIGIIDMFN